MRAGRMTAIARALTLGLLVMPSVSALAQPAYPARAIRFITPFPPGGSLDPLTRMCAQKLSEKWGQPGVVENRPGGNSIIGTNAVAKAAPDGYTLLVAGTPHVINPSLFPTPYDALKDFAPVATIAKSRQILVINPSLPVNSLKELIALAKARPGQLNYGSSGTGNTNHLAAELLLRARQRQDAAHPLQGRRTCDRRPDQRPIAAFFHVTISVIPHIRSGRLKPLAISGEPRAAALPQVPTFAEAGCRRSRCRAGPGSSLRPARRSPSSTSISGEMANILSSPEIVERMGNESLEPFISNPEQFAALLRSDMARFAKLIKDANIKVEP